MASKAFTVQADAWTAQAFLKTDLEISFQPFVSVRFLLTAAKLAGSILPQHVYLHRALHSDCASLSASGRET